VLCFIVVPLPPSRNQFAVQLNKNNDDNKFSKHDINYVVLYVWYRVCTDHIFIVKYDHILLFIWFI
jgi:hypothetical protein